MRNLNSCAGSGPCSVERIRCGQCSRGPTSAAAAGMSSEFLATGQSEIDGQLGALTKWSVPRQRRVAARFRLRRRSPDARAREAFRTGHRHRCFGEHDSHGAQSQRRCRQPEIRREPLDPTRHGCRRQHRPGVFVHRPFSTSRRLWRWVMWPNSCACSRRVVSRPSSSLRGPTAAGAGACTRCFRTVG